MQGHAHPRLLTGNQGAGCRSDLRGQHVVELRPGNRGHPILLGHESAGLEEDRSPQIARCVAIAVEVDLGLLSQEGLGGGKVVEQTIDVGVLSLGPEDVGERLLVRESSRYPHESRSSPSRDDGVELPPHLTVRLDLGHLLLLVLEFRAEFCDNFAADVFRDAEFGTHPPPDREPRSDGDEQHAHDDGNMPPRQDHLRFHCLSLRALRAVVVSKN